jgi:SAM-dependent methyltransferase
VSLAATIDEVLDLLRCPICRGVLDAPTPSELKCRQCGRETAIVRGVPRFVKDEDFADTDEAARTRASFGYEWTHFNDWKPSGATFGDYFSNFDLEWLRGRTVLDAGCGMGRHALQIAPFAKTVLAVDFSNAINEAARNVSDHANVQCLQGDLTRLPVADDAFDFVFSMGVLHHIDDTVGTLQGLVRALKPGGRLRLYLYWKRTGLARALLSLVTAARLVTTRLPFSVLRVLCWILSVLLMIGVILPYRALHALGVDVRETWPLAIYIKYPFNVLYNDQFDRFSAPIEKRYSEDEVRELLSSAGLRSIRVHSKYGWIGDGVK